VSAEVEVKVLGPLEVLVDGSAVRVGGGMPRALLGVLALSGGRVVSPERLIEELWGAQPPRTARAALQGYVAQLRRALGSGSDHVLVTERGGYRLRLAPGALDLVQFERLVERARVSAGAG
jgi:DNA-binding SARP family transcriptional activator